MLGQVVTPTPPIHHAGHQGPAKRLREAPHHLPHVFPVSPEWIPIGEEEEAQTLRVNPSFYS